MRDIFHLAQTSNGLIQVFTGSGIIQTWNKPAGATIVNILSISAGGGGGGGAVAGGASPAVQISGGGGGASGTIARLMIPARLLPDTLYMQIGLGGIGAAGRPATAANVAGLDGGLGGISALGVSPNLVAGSKDLLFYHTNTNNNGKAGAWAYSGSTTTPAAITSANSTLASLGLSSFSGGQLGQDANSGTPTAIVFLAVAGCFVSGGGAGAGWTSTLGHKPGGSITGAGLMPTIAGGAVGESGNNGILILPQMLSTGGSGGGSSTNGGNGGNGAYGSGGGGGAGGTFGSSGAGGRGGDGIIIISCS